MKTQINLTENAETALVRLKKIAIINDLKASNKEYLIEFAIDLADKIIKHSDEDTLINLTGLKKTYK
jgi:hypothetical protein